MLTLALIVGFWTTTCIQTQTTLKQGFSIDSYEIVEAGDFIFNRRWFSDSKCTNSVSIDQEVGSLKIGKEVSMSFTPNTFEADFKTAAGEDFGVISLNKDKLKIGRGFLNTQTRNTMTGVFDFIKL